MSACDARVTPISMRRSTAAASGSSLRSMFRRVANPAGGEHQPAETGPRRPRPWTTIENPQIGRCRRPRRVFAQIDRASLPLATSRLPGNTRVWFPWRASRRVSSSQATAMRTLCRRR